MIRAVWGRVGRLVRAAVLAGCTVGVAGQAHALVIDATFSTTITGSPEVGPIEDSIDSAIADIDSLYSNPGTVSILFTTSPSIGGGESQTGLYLAPYGSSNPATLSGYTGLLAYDSLTHPGNATLATAVANLSHGNDSSGAEGVALTSALLRVGLGDLTAAPCLDSSGDLVTSNNTCAGTYDGIITLSSTLDYSRPNTGGLDAIRVIEHEIDEVLGGGGTGSTLNAVYDCANDSTDCTLAQFYGPLDLYRYQCGSTTPSYTTAADPSNTAPDACLSVDGGVTDIVGFNQDSGGDYGDFWSNFCPPDVQDAFSCAGQIADETPTSPEYQMMLAIGWDPVPEPMSLALLGTGACGLAWARRRRRGSVGAPAWARRGDKTPPDHSGDCEWPTTDGRPAAGWNGAWLAGTGRASCCHCERSEAISFAIRAVRAIIRTRLLRFARNDRACRIASLRVQ